MAAEEADKSARPFSAPDGTWPRDQWPVDVVRTDASGEVDLAHLEYNLSLTPAERIRQLQGWLNFVRLVRESRGARMVDIVALLKRLNDHGVRYVVVGGVAANVHGTTRISEDLDLFAPLDHPNAVKIIRAMEGLHPRWWMRPDLPEVTPDSHNLCGIRNIYLRTDLGRLDVLGDMEGADDYESVEGRSVERDFGGVRCRVIDIDSLIAVKRHVGREKDMSDARELELLRLAAKSVNPGTETDATI